MATAKRFQWLRLSENAPIQQVVRALNNALPMLPVEISTTASAAAAGVTRYTKCRPRIIAYDATTVTVRATGTVPTRPGVNPCYDPDADTIEVALVALANTTRISGPAFDTPSPNPSEWVLSRPAAGEVAEAEFEATLADAVSDPDIVRVPAQGEEISLVSAVRVDAVVHEGDSTATTLAVDVTLSGEGQEPPTAGTLTIASWQGLTASEATPTPVSAALPFTQRYTITRPAFGAGMGRAVWEGVSTDIPDALSDKDPVDVAEVQRDTVTLAPKLEQSGAPTATTISYYATHGSVPAGVGTVAFSAAATGGATIASGTGTLADPWVVTRPAFGAGAGRLTVTASATGAASGTDAADVQAQERDTVTLAPALSVTASPTRLDVTATCTAPVGSTAPTVDTTGSTGTVSNTLSDTTVDATRTIVIETFRQAFSANPGVLKLVWSLTGAETVTQTVSVPTLERDTVTLAPKLVQSAVSATTESYYATHESTPAGVGTISYATSGTASVASGTGTLADPWVVTRPAFNAGGTRLTVTASATGAANGTDAVDVQPQEDTSTAGKRLVVGPMDLVPQTAATPNVFTIDPAGAYSYVSGVGDVVMFGPIRVPPGCTVTEIAYTYRNPSGGTVQFYTYGGGANLDIAVLTTDTAGADATYTLALSHTVSAFVPTFFWVGQEDGHAGAQRFVKAVVTYTSPSLTVTV